MEKNFQEGILWWTPTSLHSLGLSPLEKGAMRLKWTGFTGATHSPLDGSVLRVPGTMYGSAASVGLWHRGSSEVPHRVTLKAGHLRGVEEQGWRLPDSLDGFAGDQKPCINSEEGAREGCFIPAHAVTPLTTGLQSLRTCMWLLMFASHKTYHWLRF